ncbi:LysR family transcriptional regulator|nr:LysR family transcriptional regulator [Candidatus Pantoea persica]
MSNLSTPDRIELMQTFIRIVESGSLSAEQLNTRSPPSTVACRRWSSVWD